MLPADVVFANFALLEAMARGVVPIVTDVPGAHLLVRDGENGFLAPPSADELTSTLRRALLCDVVTRLQMSASARATIAAHHSVDAWAERLLEHDATLAPAPQR